MTAGERATMIFRAVTQPVTTLPDRVIDWLARFPSTNGRIVASIIAMLGTAIRYWWTSGGANQWEPSATWLAFLATMAGIDTMQFNVKRKTHTTPPTPSQEPPQP